MGFKITDTERDQIFNQIECWTNFNFMLKKASISQFLLLRTMTAFQSSPLLFLHILKPIIKLINRNQIHSYCITLLKSRAIFYFFIEKLFYVKIIPIYSETIK